MTRKPTNLSQLRRQMWGADDRLEGHQLGCSQARKGLPCLTCRLLTGTTIYARHEVRTARVMAIQDRADRNRAAIARARAGHVG